MNSTLEEYAGICPLCGSLFKFTISVYSVVNDKDDVILKCTVCGDMFAVLQVKNHETFSDVEGVEIIDITNGIVSGFAICSDIVCIDRNSRGIFQDSIFAHIMNRRIKNPFYDDSHRPLYRCDCGNNLERITMDTLFKIKNFTKIMQKIGNEYHSRRWHGLDLFVFTMPIECTCKREYTSILFTHAFLYGEIPRYSHFLIAGIQGCMSHRINGVFSKDVCHSFIRKFAARWNLIASYKYITSAFIGNQFLSAENTNGLWNNLSMTFSPNNKATLITKSSTKKRLQKKIEESQNLSMMNKYGMLAHEKINIFRCEKTHAKFYAALTCLGVEIISGSFNYATGPSTDNLCYSLLTKEEFDNDHLRNISAQLIINEQIRDSDITVIGLQPQGSFSIDYTKVSSLFV